MNMRMEYILLLFILSSLCIVYANHPLKLRPRGVFGQSRNIDFSDSIEQNDSNIMGSYVAEEIACSNESSFFCADRKMCIDMLYECDNFSDCSDGSDEHESCSYFSCGDGYTLSSVFVCDDINDCVNGHDEDAEHGNCDVVQCGNGSETDQVTDTKICDGVYDCRDDFNSDECNCSFTFNCANKRCIHEDDRCNQVDDCGDGSDEANCSNFVCINGNRISDNQLCDGIDQCGDSTDECNCDDTKICLNNRCILDSQRCNGIDDCGDTSDECWCYHSFICNNSRCISDSLVGNGFNDCGDNSDEIKKTSSQILQTTAAAHKTTAAAAYKTTAAAAYKTSAAAAYKTTAAANQATASEDCTGHLMMKCPSGECVHTDVFCDGKVDCMEGTDEENCSMCGDSDEKIHFGFLCDGLRNCANGYDECNCPGREYKPGECPSAHEEATTLTTSRFATTTRHISAYLPTATLHEGNGAPKAGVRSIVLSLCWGLSLYLALQA